LQDKTITIREVYIPADKGGSGNVGGGTGEAAVVDDSDKTITVHRSYGNIGIKGPYDTEV